MSIQGSLHRYFSDPAKVDAFCMHLKTAFETPTTKDDRILASMYQQLFVTNRPLTGNQIEYALDLINRKVSK